jgi:hypothetical protein
MRLSAPKNFRAIGFKFPTTINCFAFFHFVSSNV